MIGALLGFFLALSLNLICDDVSLWWLLWGSLIGITTELAARLLAGAPPDEAVENAATAVVVVIDVASQVADNIDIN